MVFKRFWYVFLALVGFGASAAVAFGMLRGSRILHDRLLHNVIRCPMSFFDMTPIGRVLNRFSADVNIIDVLLPNNLRSFMLTLVSVSQLN